MTEARDVMRMLWEGDMLPAQYLDHELQGEWTGNRECHIRGDFLLVYQVTKTDVIFVDTGTHAELFK
jgi:mRNA interferase YafQ